MITNKRIIETLDWLVADYTWRADQTKLNFEGGSQGGYSPKLTEAIELLKELKDLKQNEKIFYPAKAQRREEKQ